MTKYKFIQTQSGFFRFLDEIEDVTWIAYDTEFISEGRYQPELCLVQVATEKGNYLLDPLSINNLNPFWERLCEENTTSIAHACRSELEFCHRAIGRFPARIFDVQLAAAFVGFDYPLNFKMLTHGTIGVDIEKTETRTDWSRRPLLTGQLNYALNDVVYLKQIAEYLTEKLERAGRVRWFLEETREYCTQLKDSFIEEHWRKLLRSKHYSRDELAVIRELWNWRHDKALAKNIAPGRVLRDDLLLEIAKHQTADPQRIANIRGVRGLPESYLVRELSEAIDYALSLPNSEKPKLPSQATFPQYSLATQILNVLVGQYCKNHNVSSRIVATAADIRYAIAAYRGDVPESEPSKLLQGWRAEFLGEYFINFLEGRCVIQLTKDLESHPFRIVKLDANGNKEETGDN